MKFSNSKSLAVALRESLVQYLGKGADRALGTPYGNGGVQIIPILETGTGKDLGHISVAKFDTDKVGQFGAALLDQYHTDKRGHPVICDAPIYPLPRSGLVRNTDYNNPLEYSGAVVEFARRLLSMSSELRHPDLALAA